MDYQYYQDVQSQRVDMDNKFYARDNQDFLQVTPEVTPEVTSGMTTQDFTSVVDVTFNGTIHNEGLPEFTHKGLLIGCALAVGGNLLISISLNLQKYTHMRNERLGETKHYTKSPIWWLGLTLMGLGELGNFSAYGFAPASLVAPLGTTTVVANMFIAVLFLKEKLRIEDLFGCTFAMIGAFLLVSYSQKNEKVLTAKEIEFLLLQPAFLVYCGIEIFAFITLFLMYYKLKYENVLVILLITSLLASFTVISAKAVSSMINITFKGDMQIQYSLFWIMLLIMIVTAVVQVKFLNIAMMSFNATIVVPTNFVFFTISAILAGTVLYREFWGMSALEIFMFLFGCILCFIGVYFITVGRATVNVPADASSNEDEDSRMSNVPNWIRKILPTWLFARCTKNCITKVEDDEAPFAEQNFDDKKEDTHSSSGSLPMTAVDSSEETKPVSSPVKAADYGAVSQ